MVDKVWVTVGVGNSNDWDMKLSLVAAFREECGRLPKFSDTYRGVRIGRWLYAQRKALLPGRDDERIERLRAIGAVPFVRQKNEKRKNGASYVIY